MTPDRLTLISDNPNPRMKFDPNKRGYVIRYHSGMECPGCHYSKWMVGRKQAECGVCHLALDLPGVSFNGS